MSFSNFTSPRGRRNTILASVAVAALGVAGALGEGAFTPMHPAYAAAVSTADLPQNAPSFAPLIDRVKASVVSVKVKMVADDGDAADLSGQMDNLPPQIQKFFKQFGGLPRRRHASGPSPDDDGRRLGLLHFVRRVHRHQQPRGRPRQVRHRHHA